MILNGLFSMGRDLMRRFVDAGSGLNERFVMMATV